LTFAPTAGRFVWLAPAPRAKVARALLPARYDSWLPLSPFGLRRGTPRAVFPFAGHALGIKPINTALMAARFRQRAAAGLTKPRGRATLHTVGAAVGARCTEEASMIVVNTETVPGHVIVEVKGMVQGSTVRAKNVGRDIAASFKNMIGGELKGYTELLTESRREALSRMLAQASELGANAVINVRFATSAITAGAAEMLAYGTAVTVQPS
jgi:uncharacterized protein YbjQ (UPF0145 family)